MNQIIYPHAVIATDIVVFGIRNGELIVPLIGMKKEPFVGMRAIPGGLIKSDESVAMGAARILEEKTGVRGVYLEQLATFGAVDRDPFGRVVSVAYFALISSDSHLKTTREYSGIEWFSAVKPPKLAYDHAEILTTAIKRLRSKLSYTNIVYGLLPRRFTLSDLQKVYEIILAKKIDKRNFRKKILMLKLVKPTGENEGGTAHRPAKLYEFILRKPREIEVI